MHLATRVLRGLSFLTALGFVPAVANAESPTTVYTRSWTTCSAGAVRSCHSVSLQTQGTYSGTTRVGTSVVLRVRNLQGQNPVDNMAWSALNGVRLFRPGVLAVGTAPSTAVLAGGATGTPATWTWGTGGSGGWGNVRVLANGTNRLGGCATGSTNSMWTCPGEVVFSISSALIFNANEFSELYLTWNGPNGAGDCTTDPTRTANTATPRPVCDLENTTITTTVTPEPITMALLGTGLLGVGGARLRRRSKEEV
jgi:hypothetical protein